MYQQSLCQDTLKIAQNDTLSADIVADTTVSDTSIYVAPESKFKTTVNYHARDSIRFDVTKNIVYLYGNVHIDYDDIQLDSANYVEIDWNTSTLLATYSQDSTGKKSGIPIFSEGGKKYQAEEIQYNFNSNKGIMKKVITEEDPALIHVEKAKKDEHNNLHILEGKYTTCNLEHPHFYIRARKLKIIPEKQVLSGPFHLSIADVPTPLGFIFGLFPIPKEKASGIIIPSYGESNRGFFFRNGGYYWAVNDYVGLKFLGDIYTNGSWRADFRGQYKLRYKFSGDLRVSYSKVFDGFDRENTNIPQDFKLIWNHSTASKGRSRFSAKVDFGSTTFDRNNSFNVQAFQRNITTSNISYSTSFKGTPFSLGVKLRHEQNRADSTMMFTLPDFSFNMNRIYPFKQFGRKKTGLIKNLNVNYAMSFQNRMSNIVRTNNYAFDVNNMVDTNYVFEANFKNTDLFIKRANYGVRHTANATSAFKILKHFNVSPTLRYTETWYPNRLSYTPRGSDSTVAVDTVDGFARYYSYNTGASLNTRFYSTYLFKSKKIYGIRHIMNPSLSFNYQPDFGSSRYGFYDEFNLAGTDYVVSEFQGNAYILGGPTRGEVGSIGLNIQNTVEMKVYQKNDTTGEGPKSVKLLENLGFSTSYNLAADSFQLNPFRISARTSLFGMSINSGMTIDPYIYLNQGFDSNGVFYQRRLNEYAWNNGRGIGQVTQANLALSKSFRPKKKRPEKYENEDAPEEELEEINNNPNLYVDFSIPWSLTLSYNLNYVKTGFLDKQITQTLNFRGDFSLTEKWKVDFMGGYDIQNKEFSTVRIGILRNLHCWQMSFDWIPFGIRQSYTFEINAVATILQDLKLSKRHSWYDHGQF